MSPDVCAEAVTGIEPIKTMTSQNFTAHWNIKFVSHLRLLESQRFSGFPEFSNSLPKPLEESGFLQFVDVAIVIIGSDRCLLRRRCIDQLQGDELLGEIFKNLRRHARIPGEGVDAGLVALIEHILPRDFGIFGENFGGERFVVVDFLQAIIDRRDETLDDVGIFFGIVAACNDALLDKTYIHFANLFDADELTKAFFTQYHALRRGDHRAGDGIGAERGHGFRITAGLNDHGVIYVRAIQDCLRREMGYRAKARDADSFAAHLRDLCNCRLNIQRHAKGLDERGNLDYVAALEPVGTHRRSGHAGQVRLAGEHGLYDQRRSTGEYWVDFKSVLCKELGFVGDQPWKAVIGNRRVRKLDFVECLGRLG